MCFGYRSRMPLTLKVQPSRSGLFLSPWILAGMAAHIQMTGTVCEQLKVSDPPKGALLMAIVSVSVFLYAFTFAYRMGVGGACSFFLDNRQQQLPDDEGT